MKKEIERIDRLMAPILSAEQATELHAVLVACLTGKGNNAHEAQPLEECIDSFLAAKKLEGCSERSLRYYASTFRPGEDQTGEVGTRPGVHERPSTVSLMA